MRKHLFGINNGYHQLFPYDHSYRDPTTGEKKIVKSIYHQDAWKLDHIPYDLPADITNLIIGIYINITQILSTSHHGNIQRLTFSLQDRHTGSFEIVVSKK